MRERAGDNACQDVVMHSKYELIASSSDKEQSLHFKHAAIKRGEGVVKRGMFMNFIQFRCSSECKNLQAYYLASILDPF